MARTWASEFATLDENSPAKNLGPGLRPGWTVLQEKSGAKIHDFNAGSGSLCTAVSCNQVIARIRTILLDQVQHDVSGDYLVFIPR